MTDLTTWSLLLGIFSRAAYSHTIICTQADCTYLLELLTAGKQDQMALRTYPSLGLAQTTAAHGFDNSSGGGEAQHRTPAHFLSLAKSPTVVVYCALRPQRPR